MTKHILNRLIDGKPLTPIEDVPEVWMDVGSRYGDCTHYQCLRMGSLFKNINPDTTAITPITNVIIIFVNSPNDISFNTNISAVP